MCVYMMNQETQFFTSLFLQQMFTGHPLCAAPSAKCPCNVTEALFPRSSQVMEEMGTHAIPTGLAQVFTRNNASLAEG